MWEQIELSRHVKVARRPPGEPELYALRDQGVRAVIDLRTDAETFTDALAPDAEAMKVRAHGMEYIRVPISTRAVGAADLDRVGAALRDAPKPVLIHCASGKRAGMTAVVHSAVETGMPGREMLEMARNLDLVFGDPEQQQVFADYVDQHEARPDPLMHREETLHVGAGTQTATLVAAPLMPAPAPARSPVRRVKVIGVPAPSSAWPPSPGTLGAAAALAGAILLVLDRRVVFPVLIAAGIVVAWVADNLRTSPTEYPVAASGEIDREIADLEKRVRRLSKSA